jgi:hypothetical protein
MKLLKEIHGVLLKRLEGEEVELPYPTYEIQEPEFNDSVRLPADIAPRVALEILKDVFLGNGKPYLPAEALQCLEAMLPRVEANPGNWWNKPDAHESDKR